MAPYRPHAASSRRHLFMKFENGLQMKIRDALAAQTEPEAQYVLAGFVWVLFVITFFIVAVGGLFFGIWEFWRTGDSPPNTTDVRPQTVFTKSELQKTLQELDERAKNFESRMTAPVSVKDPS